MSDARAPDYKVAERDYMSGMKYKDIAAKYNVSLNTVKSWKTRYKWNKKGAHTKKEKVRTHKAGAPYGNHNALGNPGGAAPVGNHNAVKHGLFAKYLPQETLDIVNSMSLKPLDILWDQIQIAYAAIVRAQQINYVRDRDDKTVEKVGRKDGDTVIEDRWTVQEAWDKQSNFLKAQARAQSELRSMIKQYDEMLHNNYELASEEQKARIDILKANADKATGKANADKLDKLDKLLEGIREQAGCNDGT